MHPYLIRTTHYVVSVYSICAVAALLLSGFLVCLRLKHEHRDFYSFIAILAVVYIGVFGGAYVAYLLFSYGIQNVIRDIREGTWAFFRNGGLVFYGGLIGGIGMAFVGAKIARVRLGDYVNAIVPVIPLAHGIGRIGCTFAGCCYGYDYEGPLHIFSVQRDQIAGIHGGAHIGTFPVQPLEAALNFVMAFVLWRVSKRMRPGSWTILYYYLIAYGVERFLLEFLRGDAIRGAFAGLSTSQWISLALIAFGILMLLRERRRNRFSAA